VQALVTESEFLVAAGDLNGAQQLLLEAHQLSPNDDDVRRRLRHVDEAIDAAKAHAFLEQAMKGGARAVELARRATELRPVRDVLLRALAVFARHKAWDEVADTAEQLLDIDDEDEGALRTLLDARVAMKRWAGARDVVTKLLRVSPDDARLRGIADEIAGHLKR
jgi:tetratricopeptide (TPR) repeat protein